MEDPQEFFHPPCHEKTWSDREHNNLDLARPAETIVAQANHGETLEIKVKVGKQNAKQPHKFAHHLVLPRPLGTGPC